MRAKTATGSENDLNKLVAERQLVMVERDTIAPKPEASEGFLVGWSDQLLLLHRLSDRVDLDGYEVVRRADVSAVRIDFDRRPFLVAAANAKKLQAREPHSVDATSIRSLIASVQSSYPLVVLERERVAPDECDIGRVVIFNNGSFKMRLLSPDATWKDGDYWLDLGDITRVMFDGEYENTLALVARNTPGLQS